MQKIMVVEDNVLTQAVMQALFKSLGFQVQGITRGDKVISALREEKVDLIILDLDLPGMRGDEIYMALQKIDDLKNIPVIPFSAHAEPGSFGKLPTKNILKLPELTERPSGNAESDINEQLVDEATQILIDHNVALPQELIDHYMNNRKNRPEKIEAFLKSLP